MSVFAGVWSLSAGALTTILNAPELAVVPIAGKLLAGITTRAAALVAEVFSSAAEGSPGPTVLGWRAVVRRRCVGKEGASRRRAAPPRARSGSMSPAKRRPFGSGSRSLPAVGGSRLSGCPPPLAGGHQRGEGSPSPSH